MGHLDAKRATGHQSAPEIESGVDGARESFGAEGKAGRLFFADPQFLGHPKVVAGTNLTGTNTLMKRLDRRGCAHHLSMMPASGKLPRASLEFVNASDRSKTDFLLLERCFSDQR
jgi:hypothetical protein